MKLLEHFKELSIYPKNAKELKGLILQLAIQGKLTANWRAANPISPLLGGDAEGRGGVEPASTLLERIKAEKEQLIKDKKIRKEKPLPAIAEDEKPYELPEGWEWCYLGESMLKITDGTHHSPPNVERGDFKYVTAKNIKSDGIKLSNVTYVSDEIHKEIYARCNPELGDLLYIKDGATTGVCCINNLSEEFSMLSSVALLKNPKCILNHFLLAVLTSPYYYELMRAGMSGVAITRVTLKKLKESIIPIPPLAEQKAIVETVNTLFKEVEALEKLTVERVQLKEDFITSALRELSIGDTQKEWAFLQEYFPAFMNEENNIKKLRETILQLAVQGKLTANWRQSRTLSGSTTLTNHGAEGQTAKALLANIKAEKEQLIKDKKIKKEKPLPAITADEMPYDLPEGWEWCRMRDISFSIVPNRDKPKTFTGDITWLTTRNLDEYSTKIHHKDGDNKLSREEIKEYNARLLPIGSVIMSCVGSFGFSAVLEKEYSCNQQLHCYVPLGNTNPFYLDSIIKSSKKILGDNSSATTIAYLNKTKCDSLVASLPPLAEQQAIVEKVNSLMALCDELEKQVVASKANAEMLMQSILREVFEKKPDSVFSDLSELTTAEA